MTLLSDNQQPQPQPQPQPQQLPIFQGGMEHPSQLTLTYLADLLDRSNSKAELMRALKGIDNGMLIMMAISAIPNDSFDKLRVGASALFRAMANHDDVLTALDRLLAG